MKLYEYQTKSNLADAGISVPASTLICDWDQEISISKYPVMVKAQMLFGKRESVGGIVKVYSESELPNTVRPLLGQSLLHPDCPARIETVFSVLVEEYIDVQREIYISFSVDRARRCVLLAMNSQGGVGIESSEGDWIYHEIRKLDDLDQAPGPDDPDLSEIVQSLYTCFIRHDMTLLEINPLGLSANSEWVALDAKAELDDCAAFRHTEWSVYAANEKRHPLEHDATLSGVEMIVRDGDVAVLANGAGLMMAVADAVSQPGCLVDLKGGATPDSVRNALMLVREHPSTRKVLITIHGGILSCTIVAEGLITSFKDGLDLPVTLCLRGRDSEAAIEKVRASGYPIHLYPDMRDAVTCA